MLEEKLRNSILLMRHAYRHCRHRGVKLELSYSGGKDSDVMVELCKMADIWGGEYLRPLHRCTTIDPAGTLSHCCDNGVEVLRPKMSFRECIAVSGFPTRWKRHCCGYLKEFAVEDYALVGVRRSESARRAVRYKEPEVCRVYNGRGKAIHFMPLLDWTDDDVRDFVNERKINCHPLYYDDSGVFHVERRLGCIGCPMASRNRRIQDFKEHPKFVRFWCKAGDMYLKSHQNSKTHEYFGDVFAWFTYNLYFDKIEDFKNKTRNGLFGSGSDCFKQYLEDNFCVNLDF